MSIIVRERENMEEKKKQKKRRFVMVQVSLDEKDQFKDAARIRGFNAVSVWMKWVAKRDMRAAMKQDIPHV